MSTARIIYHLAKADFLERIRRYSFLIILGLVTFLGYMVVKGNLSLRVFPYFRGEVNSAWVGTMMSLVVNSYFGILGIYLITRDYKTGVG